MSESYFFNSIKKEYENKKNGDKIKPFTIDEYENTEEGPMELKDYLLSLRQLIQQKINTEQSKQEEQQEQEKIKFLSDLIKPELMLEYKCILQDFNNKTKKTEQHPQREFIDINNQEFSDRIENLIENLIDEIENQRGDILDENDIEELEAQCWLLFDSIANVMNTKSIEKDIKEFYKDEDNNDGEVLKQKTDLIKQLHNNYNIDELEIEILVNLIKPENYSLEILIETLSRLWDEYKLGEKKGKMAIISLGYLMSTGLQSFAPSLFQNIIVQDNLNWAVALGFFGLNKTAEYIDLQTNIELVKVINDIEYQINEKITNSLFFQEFEFIHEKSLGEIYTALEKGKNSTSKILQETISEFTPTLAGIVMSMGFLLKINPILGTIGALGLPIMYNIARKNNAKIGLIYERENKEGEKITTQLGAIKNALEVVKVSPETQEISEDVKGKMDFKDKLSLNRDIEEMRSSFKGKLSFDVSMVISAGVGFVLQEAGLISGGAILSNIMYSNRLNMPLQNLVRIYFNRFPRYIQDIQRMNEILGEYEKLDLPEGEKEKERVSVLELENFDISVKNLCYKNILRNVSLDIKQGEFLTISGSSGAGKSTFLRNLVGLYKPNGGEIEIGGVKNDKIKKYGRESLYSVMSYCNQSPQIFAGMTLRENLLLWSKDEISDEKIKKVLQDLHLDKFIDKLDEELKNLSGGEKVRIGLARTLIKGSKIMLLDEPTASLDSQSATEVRKIISEINKIYPDITIICVSHDEELIKISKRSVNMLELQK